MFWVYLLRRTMLNTFIFSTNRRFKEFIFWEKFRSWDSCQYWYTKCNVWIYVFRFTPGKQAKMTPLTVSVSVSHIFNLFLSYTFSKIDALVSSILKFYFKGSTVHQGVKLGHWFVLLKLILCSPCLLIRSYCYIQIKFNKCWQDCFLTFKRKIEE